MRVLKFGTGDPVPPNAKYLWSCKNGKMREDYEYVWHYFLVE